LHRCVLRCTYACLHYICAVAAYTCALHYIHACNITHMHIASVTLHTCTLPVYDRCKRLSTQAHNTLHIPKRVSHTRIHMLMTARAWTRTRLCMRKCDYIVRIICFVWMCVSVCSVYADFRIYACFDICMFRYMHVSMSRICACTCLAISFGYILLVMHSYKHSYIAT